MSLAGLTNLPDRTEESLPPGAVPAAPTVRPVLRCAGTTGASREAAKPGTQNLMPALDQDLQCRIPMHPPLQLLPVQN